MWIHKTASAAEYPHTDESPHTIHVDMCYTVMAILLQIPPDDEPLRLKTCRRYCMNLNYSRYVFGWFTFYNYKLEAYLS